MLNLIEQGYEQACGIYCIHNLKTNKNYIGQTNEGFFKRFNRHAGALKKGTHFNKHLQRAFNLYGTDSFIFYVVKKLESPDEIDEAEKYFIREFNSINNGYNILEGGGGMSGANHPFFGKKHSEETKRLLSELHKGMRTGPLNNFYGEDHSGEKNGFYGKKHDEETCKKMSEIKKAQIETNEEYHAKVCEASKKGAAASALVNNRKVICNETGEVFESITEAALRTGAPRTKIPMVCLGKRKHAGGFSWS